MAGALHNAPDQRHDAPPPGGPIESGAALRVWTQIAALSFGGPAGQIAVMHRILVEEKKWVTESQFTHALNYCMLLPGPEAQQLATYFGWLLQGWRGGLVAGLLFVVPGFLSILALSVLYAGFQGVVAVDALFYGLQPAVMAIVAAAVFKIGARAFHNRAMVAIAVLSWIAIFFFAVPFPFLVATAALAGLLGTRFAPRIFALPANAKPAEPTSQTAAQSAPPKVLRALKTAGLWLTIWLAPLGILALALGPDHVFVQEGSFFSKTAAVTFGGAYAVLGYVAQQAVETYGWLHPGEMLDGLGMAETTPGPLIQVVQFVGFMAAHRNPGSLEPIWAGVVGSVIVTWATFAPCFLWIFVGAPFIESLRGNRRIAAALSAVTAAVVGVIVNLALWFSIHTLFASVSTTRVGPIRLLVPDPSTLDPWAAALAAGAFVALFRFKISVGRTLAGSTLLGIAVFLLTR